MQLRNIFSRSHFSKINEASSEVKGVSNVSNEPLEIAKAWKLSLIGALSAGVVAGLTGLYKMGRAKWALANLSSKLNKEFLKGLIFYADSVNLNLQTGSYGTGATSAEVQVQTGATQAQAQMSGATEFASGSTQVQISVEDEIAGILSKINSLDELYENPTIKKWWERYSKLKQTVQSHRVNISKFGAGIKDDKKRKELQDKYYSGQLLLGGKYNFAEEEEELKNIEPIYQMIRKKEDELKRKGFEESTYKLKNIADQQGFQPNESYGDNDFVDYAKFKDSFKTPTADKISVGDEFTYYTNNGNKEKVEVTDIPKEGYVTVKFGDKNTKATIEVARLLPSEMPNFRTNDKKGILDKMEKTISTVNFDNLNAENKDEMLDLYKKYQILLLTYNDLVKSGKIRETVTESLILEKNLRIKGKGTGSIEGGDIKGAIPITDILTTKEQEKLKNKGVLSITVEDINFGKVAAVIPDAQREEVSKYVSKYNLEVIRLLANKYFGETGFRKQWQRKVNRLNGYWEDIMDIEKVNVLKDTPISTDPKLAKSVDKQQNRGDLTFDMSVLSQKFGLKKIKAKNIEEGISILMSFVYSSKFIVAGKGVASGDLFYKKMVRTSKMLEVKSEEGKEVIFIPEPQPQFINAFRGKNSQLTLDNINIPSSSEIATYFLFDADFPVTNDYNKPSTVRFFVINDIGYVGTGGERQRAICLFNRYTGVNHKLSETFDFRFKTLKKNDFLYEVDLIALETFSRLTDPQLNVQVNDYSGPERLESSQIALIKQLQIK